MKKKFSLNAFLHNERAILILSVVVAVFLWALVSFGPGNIQTRTITVTQTVDLTNTIAGYNDLRVIGNDTFTASVTVKGARAVIFNLGPEDFAVSPSLSDIQGAGVSQVSLSASKVQTGDYEIVSVSPSTITLNCDYWITTSVPLTTDIQSVSVQNEQTQQIGDIRLEANVLTNGNVQVEGPKTKVSQIAEIVAHVDKGGKIGKTSRFTATLKAVDADGKEVDLENCQVVGANADNSLNVTVPVWVQKTVNLSYQLVNKPAGITDKGLITLSPSTITLVGEEEALEASAATIGNLGKIDFDRLTPDDAQTTVTLVVPNGIKVLEGNTVGVSIAIDKLTTKKLSYAVNGLNDVKVINLPEGKTITLQSQRLSDIVLCGNAATLRRITAADLAVTLDAASNTGSGSVRYAVRITVPKYDNVWVYYGKDDAEAYRLYGTLK